ncbi:hypothetical protein PR048_009310 [Dryococelus australis]|uniref:Uncharacterized protein n=1 Tax=Dryococelus australis TaxID=614101 RepID=A0ABQ9I093_9NEOP|nr:hypothetical protein PR048_009310 [Dryococelus australis]
MRPKGARHGLFRPYRYFDTRQIAVAVYHPKQWLEVIVNASPAFSAYYIDKEDFIHLSSIGGMFKKQPDFKITSFHWIQFSSEEPNTVRTRVSHNTLQPWHSYVIRLLPRERKHLRPLPTVLPQLYEEAWEIPEETRQPVASSGTKLTCANPGATPPGTELGSPWFSRTGQVSCRIRRATARKLLVIFVQRAISPEGGYGTGGEVPPPPLHYLPLWQPAVSLTLWRGRGGIVARLLTSRLGEQGPNPGGAAPGLSYVGIVPQVGGSSGDYPISPALAFRHCSILTSLHPH